MKRAHSRSLVAVLVVFFAPWFVVEGRSRRESVEKMDVVAAQKEGKILPFESTPLPLVEAMLTLAEVDSSTVLVDLGCGDGRIARAAVRRGARRAVGVDIDAGLIQRARALTPEYESQDRLEFLVGDMTSGDMLNSESLITATVVTLYWTPDVLKRHAQAVIDHLQEGTILITHDYVIPEHVHVVEWYSEMHQEKRSINGDHVAYLYKYVVGACRDPGNQHRRTTVRPQCNQRDGTLEFHLPGGFPAELRSHTIVYSQDCTLLSSAPQKSDGKRRDAGVGVSLPVHLVVVDGRLKALWLQGADQRQLSIAYRVTADVRGGNGRPSALLGAGSTRDPVTGATAENLALQERTVPLTVRVALRLQPTPSVRSAGDKSKGAEAPPTEL